MALPWSFVSKITNSRHQITNKSQIPNSKPVQSDCFFVWDFEFRFRLGRIICLFFGICYLKFQYGNELSTKQIPSGDNQSLVL